MKVLIMKVELRAVWVHSLKEKRMVLKSILSKLTNKFNVSATEVDKHDVHQSIVIGISFICTNNAIADSTEEKILDFIESNTDAETIGSESYLETY